MRLPPSTPSPPASALLATATSSAPSRVDLETEALVIASLRHASHLLTHGTPETQIAMIRMFAGPAIKTALAAKTEDVNAIVLEVFHTLRSEMATATDDSIVKPAIIEGNIVEGAT